MKTMLRWLVAGVLAMPVTALAQPYPAKPVKLVVGFAPGGGVDMDVVVWYGVLAPAATPRDIVAKLADAVAKAAHSPDIRQRLIEQGAEPMGNPPEEFARLLRQEVATWAAVVKASGAKANE